jgi:formate--tetrahydrofolate ligase
MKGLLEAARRLGLSDDDLVPYGHDVAKVELSALARPRPDHATGATGRLVLVSAITPTSAGEGKTTLSIGLADGLSRLGHSVCLALREPSLGPCFGLKGGGTGGGASRLVPSDRINLHFTGDFHAVASAHNLLAATLDAHLHFGNELGIDPGRVLWRRVLDMDDRALRQLVVGLGEGNGPVRETGFAITAASEVMAMLCLASDEEDLRARLERTLVGFSLSGAPVTAGALGVTGAMLALLRDALHPNLVRSLEGTPAFVHGGPFANIAHGCSSILGTRMALHHADWAITEAGFGFDLGAEKFFDIKCTAAGLDTACVVLVATLRALKLHGGVRPAALARTDPDAVSRGIANLAKHVESIRAFGEPPVVALNRFAGDGEDEIEVARRGCQALGVPFAVCDAFARGGPGALELAHAVEEHAERQSRPFRPLYAPADPLAEKIGVVARRMYGARGVIFSRRAERELAEIERLGYGRLPICVAKTPVSLSDDPALGGRPEGFDLHVRSLELAAGAGFVVVLTGEIVRMPGLPRHPRAERIDLRDGEIVGLS